MNSDVARLTAQIETTARRLVERNQQAAHEPEDALERELRLALVDLDLARARST